jgi:hypothetical protein
VEIVFAIGMPAQQDGVAQRSVKTNCVGECSTHNGRRLTPRWRGKRDEIRGWPRRGLMHSDGICEEPWKAVTVGSLHGHIT